MKNQISNPTIKTEKLLKVLKFLKQAIVNNPVLPILDNFLFTDGKIISTDLRTYLISNIGFDWGTFLLPGNELIKVLSALPKGSEITLSKDPENFQVTISIEGTNKKFKLYGENSENFPSVPVTNNHIGTITQEDLIKVKSALPYVSKDELKPSMTGIFLNGQIVSTDGHRLIWFESDKQLNESFILPSKAAKILPEGYNYTIYSGKRNDLNYVEFRAIEFSVITRPIDEKYPDYKNAIPENNPIKLYVNRKELIETVKLALLAANKTTHRLKLSIKEGLEISSEDLDYNSEYSDTIPSEITGIEELFEIGFDGKLLLDFIQDLDTEVVTFEFSAPNRAAIINGNRLLMPVMLTNYVG